MRKRIGQNERLYAVLGLGRFGASLARTLYSMGHEILALDNNEDRVQLLAQDVTHAVEVDITDESALRALGLRNVDVAIVSVGEIQPSILATLIVKDLGVPCVWAKAVSDVHGKVLEKLGVDRVVYPERDMGIRVAHSLVSGNMIDYIELAPGFSIVEVVAKQDFVGRSLKQIDLRAKYGIDIIAIRSGSDIKVVPGADYIIMPEDILVAMGPDTKLEKLNE